MEEEMAASVLQKFSNHLVLAPKKKKPVVSVESIFQFAIVGKTIVPTGEPVRELMKAIRDCFKFLSPIPAVMPITDEIFVVRFRKLEHLTYVLNQGPWRIFGQIFLIKEHSCEIAPQNMVINSFKIWFYFENLPYRKRGENEITEMLEDMNIAQIYPEHTFPSDCRGYKVQAIINCEDALPLGAEVDDEFGGKKLVRFLYQQLPSFFCIRCRKVGHKSFTCPDRLHEFEGGNTLGNDSKLSDSPMEDDRISPNNSVHLPLAAAHSDVDLGTGNENPNRNDEVMGCDGPDPIHHQTAGKSVPGWVNPLGCISRPTRAEPVVVSDLNLLMDAAIPDLQILNREAMNRIKQFLPNTETLSNDEGSKQRGKRISIEGSSSRSHNVFSKKSKLDVVEEIEEDSSNQQGEIRSLFMNEEGNAIRNILNPPEFLGINFGNLPAVVTSIQRDAVYHNEITSSTFTAVNMRSPIPHMMNITRYAEILPGARQSANGTRVTRYHPYQQNHAGEQSGSSHRNHNEDRQTDAMDFLSLDIPAGDRVGLRQLEPSPQKAESVGESSTSPHGHTA